ncbi:ribose 5-phosphate isomerase B, partial [Trichinella spiralis]|uniref:ribose 5-phosphate isomerase B n=1 Tax=Trichinella spiralis TaxID=6334 RepID=UPI0001EFD46E
SGLLKFVWQQKNCPVQTFTSKKTLENGKKSAMDLGPPYKAGALIRSGTWLRREDSFAGDKRKSRVAGITALARSKSAPMGGELLRRVYLITVVVHQQTVPVWVPFEEKCERQDYTVFFCSLIISSHCTYSYISYAPYEYLICGDEICRESYFYLTDTPAAP